MSYEFFCALAEIFFKSNIKRHIKQNPAVKTAGFLEFSLNRMSTQNQKLQTQN
jgi:hypothetical protein